MEHSFRDKDLHRVGARARTKDLRMAEGRRSNRIDPPRWACSRFRSHRFRAESPRRQLALVRNTPRVAAHRAAPGQTDGDQILDEPLGVRDRYAWSAHILRRVFLNRDLIRSVHGVLRARSPSGLSKASLIERS
jgi:hypothetical protein